MNVFFVWMLRSSGSSLFDWYCVLSALIFLTRARLRYFFGSHEFDLCFVREWCDHKITMHQPETLNCLFVLLDEEHNPKLICAILRVTSGVLEEKVPYRKEFVLNLRTYLVLKGKNPFEILRGIEI
jgi:hypothetical protein